jgi:serine/threonine-protein kinase
MLCPTCGQRSDGLFCATDGTRLVDEPTSLVGSVLAERYRITRLIGEGGMGQVYEAEHVHIAKRFAIKLLKPDIVSQPATVARFRQEARSASSIGHENIVEIEDFATLPDGSVYLAMELLDGESLADRMHRGPVPLPEAAQIVGAVLRGLGAAHDKGIVHRDMKPENVFLAKKGGREVPKILDFGIAKVTGPSEEGSLNLTRTGAIFGTPLYMSPEQAKGQPTDLRTDIYSVGVILYELVTGRAPFRADSSVQLLNQHITVPPEPPSTAAPERHVPPALEAVVLRALEKEPAQRFADMRQFAAGLDEAARGLTADALPVAAADAPPVALGLASRPLGAAPSSPSLPPPDGATNRRGPLPIVLALGLAVAGGVVWFATRPRPSAPVAPPAPALAPTLPPPAPTVPPPAPSVQQVLISSAPPGARILHDGVKLAETPDEVTVPDGKTLEVTLHKEGYVDKTLTVDPAQGRKLVVHLERVPVAAPPKITPPRVAAVSPLKGTASPLKPAASPPPAPPPRPAPPVDPLGAEADHVAAQLVPGSRRIMPIYNGSAADEDGRSDWYLPLEPGHCYAFVGAGGAGIEAVYLYLWGPHGRRVADRRDHNRTPVMTFCAQLPGMYHVQIKSARGHGEYRLGVYQQR